jgi:hypothetical protein
MKETIHSKQEEALTPIESMFPLLLTRSMAENMTGLEGQYLDSLRKSGKVMVYKTKGGHYRFHRDSLITHINENLIYGRK